MTAPDAAVHYRTCHLCEAMCGLRIEVAGGRIASIRGDDEDVFSRGHICPKAAALADLHDDPERLRHPVRRTAGGWRRIDWEEALSLATQPLFRLQQGFGRDAIGLYIGNPVAHNLGALAFGPLLLRALGTRSRFSATSVDQLPHMLVSYLMFGHQLLLPVPDIDRTDYFLVFGANPAVSNGSLMSAPGMRERLRAIRRRGGRVVVVDPRRTDSARTVSGGGAGPAAASAWPRCGAPRTGSTSARCSPACPTGCRGRRGRPGASRGSSSPRSRWRPTSPGSRAASPTRRRFPPARCCSSAAAICAATTPGCTIFRSSSPASRCARCSSTRTTRTRAASPTATSPR